MVKINSNQVTFVDLTDSRKLDVYIKSNLPTTQIRNVNDQTYTPDWSVTNLILSVDMFLDSKPLNNAEAIMWYEKIGVGAETQIGTGKSITISTNKMPGDSIGLITYICKIRYQNLESQSQITFTRTDTGLNGTNGTDGTGVTILGSYNTIAELQSAHPTGNAGDAYIVGGRLYVWAIDDAQWEDVGNIQGPAGKDGENAKSIVLSGDAQVFKVNKSNTMSPSTIKVTAQAFNTTITSWTYSTNGGQTFLSTVPTGVSRNGNIVTITGSSMTSNSLTIKASDGAIEDVFTVYKAFDGTDGNKGDDGDPAPIAFLTNESIIFSANAQGQIAGTTLMSKIVAYEGTTKVTPTIGEITNVPTGMTITSSTDAASNEIMLSIAIANNSTLGIKSGEIKSIGIHVTYPVSTVLYLAWSKVNAGVGVKSTTVTYGVSDSATSRPADTAWQSTLPVVDAGKYLWTRTIIDYTDDTIADTVTYTYAKQGDKGDTGTSGSSVAVSSIQYQASNSATTAPSGTWSNTVVAVPSGNYLWTKTAFSDGKIAYGVARQGTDGSNGNDGRGISSIIEQYYQSTSATTQSGGSWLSTVPTWVDGKYIWTRSVITYTDTTTYTTTPVCVTGQKGGTGSTGAAGVGISSVDVWYYQSTSSTALSGGSWSTTAPTWSDGKYVWTKTITTYTNNTTDETTAVCITGQKGSTGAGISSVTVTYGTSTSAATQPTSWQTTLPTVAEGSYLWTRTVTDYTDASIADTVTLTYAKQGAKGSTGSAGTSVTVSSIQYQAGTSATTAPTGTWSNSVVTVAEGSYLWTKTTFSDGKVAYGVAKQGVSGRGISSVTEYYLATTASTGVTTSTSGWTTTIQSIDATKRYLWNYELITYTDNNTSTTSPILIGVFGNTGATGAAGKGIKSVTEYYLATTSSSNVTTSTSGWTTAIQTLTASKKYLWNYEVVTYTDNTTTTTTPVIIGVYGDQGVAAVAFQVYAPNGYLLTKDLESLTLQTFAYEGSTAITTGVTYQWSQLVDDTWTDITNATSTSYTVTKADVLKAKSYRCVMTYKSQTYTSTVTVQDKTDIYNSIMCISSNATSNDCYWVLYTLVYSDSEEVDPLLGPISVNAPTSPKSGDYWYAVDTINATVALKKYNGTSWANSTDTQTLSYYWDIINDGSTQVPLGASSKVKVVSCHDFTATATLVCEVSNIEDGLLTQSSLSLTDASDPIVSTTEPTATVNGQIWIKPNDNGTYLMFVWDEATNGWISSDMDTRNKVYTSRPSSYNVGDLWITASDTDHGSYLHGTLLQAQKSNTRSYRSNRCSLASRY